MIARRGASDGGASVSSTRKRRTVNVSISTLRSRTFFIARRPMAMLPMAIAPTAIAPTASTPVAIAM